MDSNTLTWWSLLCGVSALNLLVWLVSARWLHGRASALHAQQWQQVRWHMLLSAGYVLGCAYRSLFPVYDVQRIVMVDSWLSSVMVGRSVATLAELCFAAQWALLLRAVALGCGSRGALQVSRLIVPLIALAEVCSWCAVLTTANLGHVLEESLWGLSAALLVASLLWLWPHGQRALRPVLLLASLTGLAYVVYMFTVDVPMYWGRWLLDEGRGQAYFSLAQGVADASSRWAVSHSWQVWQSEVIWMSLYFSVAVWLSIGLMHVASRLPLQAQTLQRLPPIHRARAPRTAVQNIFSA